MFAIIALFAILLSIILIVMVLLQPSKSGSMGGAFGTLGSTLGSTFGSRRTLDFLAKGTTWVAGTLALLCLLANFFLSSGSSAGSGNAPATQGAATSGVPDRVPVAPAPGAGGAPAGAPAGGGQPANVQAKPAQVQAKPAAPKPAGN